MVFQESSQLSPGGLELGYALILEHLDHVVVIDADRR